MCRLACFWGSTAKSGVDPPPVIVALDVDEEVSSDLLRVAHRRWWTSDTTAARRPAFRAKRRVHPGTAIAAVMFGMEAAQIGEQRTVRRRSLF